MALNHELLTLKRLGNELAKLPSARQAWAAEWLLEKAKSGEFVSKEDKQAELALGAK